MLYSYQRLGSYQLALLFWAALTTTSDMRFSLVSGLRSACIHSGTAYWAIFMQRQ